MTPSALLLLVLAQDVPQPPPGPGRPPPLANGLAIPGRLGSDCGDRQDEAGRWRHETWTTLADGQRIWLSITSPDFDAVLQVFDDEGMTVATVEDRRDETPTGRFVNAPVRAAPGPSRTYTLRVTSAEPGQTGRWRVEDRRDGSDAQMFFGEILPPFDQRGCPGP